jgi:hypothetical protein
LNQRCDDFCAQLLTLKKIFFGEPTITTSLLRGLSYDPKGAKYERSRAMAGLLKFLVLFVSGVVVMHKLRPYGVLLF